MHPSASAGVRLSAIVALAALVIFIVCPLGSIFITSFTGSENESLLVQHALDAALASENVETVVNSIVLAGLVVVLTTVMATPLALLLSRTSWGQSHWLDVALLIPFMTPPYIGAMGWILFMQKRGLLEQLLPPAGQEHRRRRAPRASLQHAGAPPHRRSCASPTRCMPRCRQEIGRAHV